MANKNVAMFVQENGERVQVGWASPAVDGVRTWDLLPGHENVRLKDVSFEDDENTQKVAAEQEENTPSDPEPAEEEPLPSAPTEDEPDEEQAADPVDAGVDLASGGEITEVAEEEDDEEEDDEEAEFQRELEAEQARFAEENKENN